MEKKTFELNGKNYPENLKDLKEDKVALSHYQIKQCYYLELKHRLMGCFPAVINGTDRMIVTEDEELLQKIWEKFSPRESKMNEDLFYVHEDGLVGYPSKNFTGDDSQSIACQLITQKEYDVLTTPFKWAPGLIGGIMSPAGFLAMVESAKERN